MTFLWPIMLLFLLVIPTLLFWYLRLQQRRKQIISNYAHFGFGQGGPPGQGPGIRRHIPPALFLLGLTILIISLARPQMTIGVPRIVGTVILAFDVSGSMAADDMNPNRIEAAKAAARDFVERQPSSVRIGIVAFSDNGFSVQAPTDDQNAILASINRLAPQRGTSLANGIIASLNTIAAGSGQDSNTGGKDGEPAHLSDRAAQPTPSPTPMPKGTYTSSVIVLLTDGENNESPDPNEAAQSAADRGVRIHTIGIGSPGGATLKVDGFTVHTQLNQAMLEQISAITGGTYYNANSDQELRAIYDNLDPKLTIKNEKTEMTSVFAGAGILVLLMGGTLSLLWFSRLP